MKRTILAAAVSAIALLGAAGCRVSGDAVPSPTAESLAEERRRIEADPNMPPVAKQSALSNLNRREQEMKK